MSRWQPSAEPLRGIVVPMVTPLAAVDELDAAGLERLVDRLLAGRVHGLFLLGTCGEGPSLSGRLQRELVERACQQVGGRVPVLVGITDSSLAATVAMARHAAEAGAAAVVTAAPFYYPISQNELVAYAEQLAAASPLPVMLYNMPALTKVTFAPETVRRLMDRPRVIGLKDSSGDIDYFRRVRELTRGRADWSLLMGPEHLLAEAIELGGDGGVSGGANVCPELYVQLYEAARADFSDETALLRTKAATLGHIYSVGEFSAASVVKGLKAALSLLGVCSGLPCPPLAPLSASQLDQVEKILRSLGVGGASMEALMAQQQ
jgi:4-hydroxy-tetrahydrodipicolinate synthase